MVRLALFVFCLLSISACINKEELKEEIKEDLRQETKNNTSKIEKGDGSVFYNEQVSIGRGEYYVHHSTLRCPYIRKGVQRNFSYTNREDFNLYCSKCMDDNLIDIFVRRYFPPKKQQ